LHLEGFNGAYAREEPLTVPWFTAREPVSSIVKIT
jgi:hypothetical protein